MTADVPNARFAHIDALRAIAALLVVWTHTSQAFTYVTNSDLWVYQLSLTPDSGRIGVVIFFLISGFVIPSSLDRIGPKLATARAFVIRRFFRLYPIYWLSIPLAVLTFDTLFGKSVDPATLLANVTMIQDFLGYQSVEGVYWTLQTELVFYAACIALFLTVGLRSNRVIATVAGLLLALYVLGFVPSSWQGVLADGRTSQLLAHLSLMFLGTLLRRWHDGQLPGLAARTVTLVLAGFWLVWPTHLLGLVPVAWVAELPHGDIAYGIAMAVFLLGAFVVRIRQPGFVAVGQASYALYLFHPIVFWPIVWLLELPVSVPLRGFPLYVYLLPATAAAIWVARLLYRWVELPMIALGARLSGKRLSAPAVEAI